MAPLTTTDSTIKIDHTVLRLVLCIQDYWQWWLMVVSVSAGCCFIEDLAVKKANVGQRLTVYWCELWKSSLTSDWIIGCLVTEMPSCSCSSKSSPSYTSAAWISPQGMWEMYLTYEKRAVWNNFTLCCGSAMRLSRVGRKWLELNIYSRASQPGIRVSGNILLWDTFPPLSGVDPAVTFAELCLSTLHQVPAAMNRMPDGAAFKSPACTKFFGIFSADRRKNKQKQGCYLLACQSISLLYLQPRSEVCWYQGQPQQHVFPIRVWDRDINILWIQYTCPSTLSWKSLPLQQ